MKLEIILRVFSREKGIHFDELCEQFNIFKSSGILHKEFLQFLWRKFNFEEDILNRMIETMIGNGALFRGKEGEEGKEDEFIPLFNLPEITSDYIEEIRKEYFDENTIQQGEIIVQFSFIFRQYSFHQD